MSGSRRTRGFLASPLLCSAEATRSPGRTGGTEGERRVPHDDPAHGLAKTQSPGRLGRGERLPTARVDSIAQVSHHIAFFDKIPTIRTFAHKIDIMNPLHRSIVLSLSLALFAQGFGLRSRGAAGQRTTGGRRGVRCTKRSPARLTHPQPRSSSRRRPPAPIKELPPLQRPRSRRRPMGARLTGPTMTKARTSSG